MSELSQLILIVALILLSAFFAASEVAFYSVSNIKVQALLKQNRKGAKSLQKLKDNPKKTIITILICNDFVNIAASGVATILAIQVFGSSGLGIAVGVMTFLILFFGDMIPKNIANVHSESIALITAPIINIVMTLISPLASLFDVMTKIILSLIRVKKKSEITEEELWATIEMEAGQKVISEAEMRYMESVLRYKDVQVKEVMTPRIKIFALEQDMKISDSVKKIIKSGYTRVPVFHGSVDKISGFVHIVDILSAFYSKKEKKLKDIKRKILYFSEEMQAKDAFSEMQKKHIPVGVVLDEFHGTEGIVTMEDLIEEIVGEVLDENDPRKTNIRPISPSTVIVNGDVKVEFVDAYFNIDTLTKLGNFPDVAAVIENQLKRLPRPKDKVKVGDLYIQVVQIKNKFPVKVIIKHVRE